jgi:hypothetical protein
MEIGVTTARMPRIPEGDFGGSIDLSALMSQNALPTTVTIALRSS